MLSTLPSVMLSKPYGPIQEWNNVGIVVQNFKLSNLYNIISTKLMSSKCQIICRTRMIFCFHVYVHRGLSRNDISSMVIILPYYTCVYTPPLLLSPPYSPNDCQPFNRLYFLHTHNTTPRLHHYLQYELTRHKLPSPFTSHLIDRSKPLTTTTNNNH